MTKQKDSLLKHKQNWEERLQDLNIQGGRIIFIGYEESLKTFISNLLADQIKEIYDLNKTTQNLKSSLK